MFFLNTYRKLKTLIRSYFLILFLGKYKLNGFRIGSNFKLINLNGIKIGKGVNIGSDCIINCYENDKKIHLNIGDNVSIGRDFQLNAYNDVSIESNVVIADRVYISDATHNKEDSFLPIINQGTSFVSQVTIKEGAWIGINVCILPGVSIGKNSVIAANSVVTKDVLDNEIVGGIPAKAIK
tara:strand:+ start:111 stop:653 length:543 start_codon:yes stop_codon:yes gene_type:complete